MGRSVDAVFPTHVRDGGLLLEAGCDGVQFSWRDVIANWRQSSRFADAFSVALSNGPYQAFFWETPALSAGKLDTPFECMLVPANSLEKVRASKAAFTEILAGGAHPSDVVAAPNLGGDAELVIPCDDGSSDYAHLAAFLRTASKEQVRLLWLRLGDAVTRWLENDARRPFWLSTSGLGVPWLHIRLDTRPKYYSHAPYKQAAS